MHHLASSKRRCELGRVTDQAQCTPRASGPLGQHEEPNLRSGSAHDLRHCRRSSRPLLSLSCTGNRATSAGAKSSRTEGALVKVVRPRHGGRVAIFTWSNLLSSRKQPRPWSRAGSRRGSMTRASEEIHDRPRVRPNKPPRKANVRAPKRVGRREARHAPVTTARREACGARARTRATSIERQATGSTKNDGYTSQ